jgi:predicted GTPase
MGAAGRDFHNFNVVFRNDPSSRVVAFTAAQIPGIERRKYPGRLAGPLYPKGIRIYPEDHLPALLQQYRNATVVFSYSDVSHEYVMHRASEVLAQGADFLLLGPDRTQIESRIPVISVCATRTGAGKSQTARHIVRVLREYGKKVVVVRHPMPYGDLAREIVQRFETLEDLDTAYCTIEEREEYEPHIMAGAVVFAGVDYQKILRVAEKEADIIVWDGGNNDFPFFRSNLEIVVTDPLRPGDELRYHPGETNLLRADIVVINKEDAASRQDIDAVVTDIRRVNPTAEIIHAASPVSVDDEEAIAGKRVAVVEDGPTLTHGEMSYGAGWIAAKGWEAGEIVSPVPYAVGSLRDVFDQHPRVRSVIPAMGYSKSQIEDLRDTLEAMPVDIVVSATPTDLSRFMKISHPIVRVSYQLIEIGSASLEDALVRCLNLSPPSPGTEPLSIRRGTRS